MRILCLTARLPYPPDRGDRLRAFNVIKHLSREHELSLVSFVAHESERAHLDPLRSYCEDVHLVPMSRRQSIGAAALNTWRREPLQALYYRSRKMRDRVREVLARNHCDAAYVHLFRMAPYLAGVSSLYRIVDLTDVISSEVRRSLPYRDLGWRLVYGLEHGRIRRYEQWVAANFEETWLVSEADRRLLAEACPGSNIQVVRNGVDTQVFHPTGQPVEPDSLLFVGHMGVFHNVDAATLLAQEILPAVRRQIPRCRLSIVGAMPSRRVRALAQDPAVSVTGFVPDLNDRLNRAAVVVAPLRFAAGVQNKVLEAMAAGRPVITNSLVNQGVGAVAGEHLVVADDVEVMVGEIVSLLRDEERRARIGLAGMTFVRQHFTWDQVVQRVRAIEQSRSPEGQAG